MHKLSDFKNDTLAETIHTDLQFDQFWNFGHKISYYDKMKMYLQKCLKASLIVVIVGKFVSNLKSVLESEPLKFHPVGGAVSVWPPADPSPPSMDKQGYVSKKIVLVSM